VRGTSDDEELTTNEEVARKLTIHIFLPNGVFN